MWFLLALSWMATVIQIGLAAMSLAAGLYYLAELVEEYTVMAGKLIKMAILFCLAVHLGFLCFEEFPLEMNVLGIVGQVVNLCLLTTFPVVQLLSPSFVASIGILVAHHYVAFGFFANHYYPFSEILAYFTICLWLIPFSFFVSLSANDNTLPIVAPSRTFSNNTSGTEGESDVISNYFSTKSRRKYGLLPMFNSIKDWMLPERSKRYT